jgi:hypothetical protein
MKSRDVLLQAGPISEEFQCDLGHKRRKDRVQQVADALAERPNESFPEVFDNPTDLEGVYRILGNDNVTYDKLLAGHQEATRQRVAALGKVAVLHDTTEFNWALRATIRWGLGELSKGRQGFFGHASIAVSADGLRCPLGCARMRLYARPDDLRSDDEREWWSERYPYWDSEFDRWLEGVEETEKLLGDDAELIHIMDREGDSYELFHYLVFRQLSFVIRLGQVRRVYDPATGALTRLDKVLEEAPICAERTITISERLDAGRNPYERKTFPAREGREARVSIRACQIEVCRPGNRKDLKHLSKRIPVNLVEVVELEPPEGQEPVHWVLITSEPIDTEEQVLQVVDLYRSRWLIEEFFKSIKTGCAYRKRQLESVDTLINALAITLPIAWRLLALRHLERTATEEPAGAVVSDVQLALLQKRAKGCKWSATPKLGEVLFAVARLGGFQKSNGRPGWQILGRGWAKLMMLEAGYWLALEMMQNEQHNNTRFNGTHDSAEEA